MLKALSASVALALSPLAVASEVIAEQNFNALSASETFTSDDVSSGSPLTNGASFNQGGSGLDFQTVWVDTRSLTDGPVDGTESGDYIGVNSYNGSNAPDVSADGTSISDASEHNYEFNDADGRLDLIFESVDLSGHTDRQLSLNYWVNADTFEDDDSFVIALSDGVTDVEIYSVAGSSLEALALGDSGDAAEWQSLTIDLENTLTANSLSETLTLTISVDNNAGGENIFVDDILFSSGADSGVIVPPDPEPEPTEIGACFDTQNASFSYISAVQGSDTSSPLVDQNVVIEGVVTALRNNGFFIQEEQSDEDSDTTTSEGIFVYYTNDLPSVNATVRLAGTIEENYNLTQISDVVEIVACDTDTTPAITTVSISLPFADDTDLEYFEGMMVSVTNATVFDTATLWQYGEMGVSDTLKQQPTDLYAPLSDGYEQQVASNAANIIYIEDNTSSSYPDELSFFTEFSYANPIRIGDTVAATGPLNYAFNRYRINPVEEITLVGEREAAPTLDEGNLKIATFNVLNYFNGEDDGSGATTFDYDANRGAESAEEFALQEARIVAAIGAMDADIVGLMEVENDGFASDSAIASLVVAINEQLAEEKHYTFVATADESLVGTDAIAVGIIYRDSVVSVVGDAAKIEMPAQLQADDSSFQQMRVSLLQSFIHDETDTDFTIVVNHFKSKGSGCYEDSVDTTDIDSIQGSCNALRVSAAMVLGDALTNDSLSERILILGDLNAYSAEDPLAVLTDYDPATRGYTISSAVRTYLAGEELNNGDAVDVTTTYGYQNVAELHDSEGFSYWYYDTALTGSLDHVLASPSITNDILDATHWNINAIEAYQLQYDQALSYYSDADGYAFTDVGPYRSSDHDPFIVTISFSAGEVTPLPSTDNSASSGGSAGFGFFVLCLGVLFVRRRANQSRHN